jgi:uncharacterized Tic20 family protein
VTSHPSGKAATSRRSPKEAVNTTWKFMFPGMQFRLITAVMNDQPQPPLPGPARPLLPPEEIRARSWNMWCHLSALSALVGIPFGTVLGPLLIWQIKKHEVPSVVAHGKAALNFQLTVLLATLVVVAAAIPLMFIVVGLLLLPLVFLIPVVGLIFAVIAGVKANEGQLYQYPLSLQLIT